MFCFYTSSLVNEKLRELHPLRVVVYLTQQSLHPVTTASSPSQQMQRAPPMAPRERSEASATTPKSQMSQTRTMPSSEHVANASLRDPHATERIGLFCDDDTYKRHTQCDVCDLLTGQVLIFSQSIPAGYSDMAGSVHELPRKSLLPLICCFQLVK